MWPMFGTGPGRTLGRMKHRTDDTNVMRPWLNGRDLAIAAVAVTTLMVACGGSTRSASTSSAQSTASGTTTTTTTVSSEQQQRAAAMATASTLCADAKARLSGLESVASTATALSSASASVRSIIDSDVTKLTALDLVRADQAAEHELQANLDEARADLDRSAARVAAGDLSSGSALYSDAVDHFGEMASILRRLGATCDGDPQQSRDGMIAPVAAIDVGTVPGQVTAAGDNVWVSLFDGRSVVRIDARTSRVVATIPVDDDDLRTIQVTTDGVWVRGATAIHHIDPNTNQVTRSVPKRAIGDNITRAYVDDDAIWACNGATLVRASKDDGHPDATVTLPYQCGTLTSAGGQVWVASDAGQPGQLSHVDASSMTVVATVPTPTDDATFPAIGSNVVWTHGQDGTTHPLAVGVDAATHTVVHTAPLPSGSGPGSLTATDSYAAATGHGIVEAINVASGTIERTFDAGAAPNALSISGRTMWVADEAAGQILRFELP